MDAYMEHLVKKNTEPKDLILKFGSIGLIAAATIAVFFFSPAFSILVGLGLAMLYRYLIFPLTDIEYEYLYCDKTITVSKIMAKEKRKDLETFDIDKMEILAPSNSYRLGEFKNRDLKEVNYWSMDSSREEPPYAMIYEGGRKILLDLPEDFVKLVQNNAPRKVFFD